MAYAKPLLITEAILSRECRVSGNKRLEGLENIDALRRFSTLPFLSVESDGNPMPQILESQQVPAELKQITVTGGAGLDSLIDPILKVIEKFKAEK